MLRERKRLLTGTVRDEDMPALYRSADVLAFPSTREGFGLAVLEAMACGTPVLVSRIAPFTEYLRDADCAWADPLDVRSITAALHKACEPGTAQALQRRGYAVSARFSWSASAAAHARIYGDFAPSPHHA